MRKYKDNIYYTNLLQYDEKYHPLHVHWANSKNNSKLVFSPKFAIFSLKLLILPNMLIISQFEEKVSFGKNTNFGENKKNQKNNFL